LPATAYFFSKRVGFFRCAPPFSGGAGKKTGEGSKTRPGITGADAIPGACFPRFVLRIFSFYLFWAYYVCGPSWGRGTIRRAGAQKSSIHFFLFHFRRWRLRGNRFWGPPNSVFFTKYRGHVCWEEPGGSRARTRHASFQPNAFKGHNWEGLKHCDLTVKLVGLVFWDKGGAVTRVSGFGTEKKGAIFRDPKKKGVTRLGRRGRKPLQNFI